MILKLNKVLHKLCSQEQTVIKYTDKKTVIKYWKGIHDHNVAQIKNVAQLKNFKNNINNIFYNCLIFKELSNEEKIDW